MGECTCRAGRDALLIVSKDCKRKHLECGFSCHLLHCSPGPLIISHVPLDPILSFATDNADRGSSHAVRDRLHLPQLRSKMQPHGPSVATTVIDGEPDGWYMRQVYIVALQGLIHSVKVAWPPGASPTFLPGEYLVLGVFHMSVCSRFNREPSMALQAQLIELVQALD